MRGLKTMLFGVAVVCFGGFSFVGQTIGFSLLSPFFWVMLLGLAICFVGLATNDSDDSGVTATESSDGRGDESGLGDGDESSDDENSEDEEDEIAQDAHYYSASRFPPM